MLRRAASLRPQSCMEQSWTPSPALSIFNPSTGIPLYKVLWSPSWHQQPQITAPAFCEIRGNSWKWLTVSSWLSVLQCAMTPTNLSFFSESYRDSVLKMLWGLAWTTPPGTAAQDSLPDPKWTWITNSFFLKNIFNNFRNVSLPTNTILCHEAGSQAFEDSLFSLPFQGGHCFPEVWDPPARYRTLTANADGIRRVTPAWTGNTSQGDGIFHALFNQNSANYSHSG